MEDFNIIINDFTECVRVNYPDKVETVTEMLKNLKEAVDNDMPDLVFCILDDLRVVFDVPGIAAGFPNQPNDNDIVDFINELIDEASRYFDMYVENITRDDGWNADETDC